MFRHIVLLTFKEGASAQDRERTPDVLRLLEKIPGVVSVEIGLQVQAPRPGKIHYQIAEVVTFKDRASLDNHRSHPVHDEVATFMRAIADWTSPLDYEISD